MRQVLYPKSQKSLNDLKVRYNKALITQDMKNRWKQLRTRIPCGNHYPKRLSRLLSADFHHLLAYYCIYIKHPILVQADLDEANEIFNYKANHDSIADFFMNPANGFDLTTCHYCELSFINAYKVKNEEEGLYFINHATANELKEKLKLKSLRTPNKIVALQPNLDKATFNSLFSRSSNKFDTIFPEKDLNHFDLDHVLDKGSCPLVALSLMNFVPSCPVCNERLKHSHVLGVKGLPYEKLSPTSPKFDFDGNAKFLIIPKSTRFTNINKTKHPDLYDLKLDVSPDYVPYARIFKLQDRYQYHKLFALHWSDLKFRYNWNRLSMMANAIHDPSFTAKRIHDDIFQKELDKDGKSCFGKLKRDILE